MNRTVLTVVIIAITIITLGAIFGIDESSTPPKSNTEITVKYSKLDKINYIHDKQTNLCFATYKSQTAYGYTVVSITYVPCNLELIKLLEEDKEK